MKKKSILIIGIILVISLFAVGFTMISPTIVEGIKVEKTDYKDQMDVDGKMIAAEEVLVYSKTPGIVTEILVTEGQYVQMGDVLYVIDDTIFKLQLEELKGQRNSLIGQKLAAGEKVNSHEITAQSSRVDLAKSAFEEATKQFTSNQTLYKTGALSENTFEQSKRYMEDSEKKLIIEKEAYQSLKTSNLLTKGTETQYLGMSEQIDAQINILNEQISNCMVKSQKNGVVGALIIKTGQMITTMEQTLKIFSPDKLEVEVYVLTEDAADLKSKDLVQLSRKRKGTDDQFLGVIKTIAPTAVDQVSTLGLIEQRVKVVITFEHQSNSILRPGDQMTVAFVSYEKADSVVIPRETVFTVDDGEAVWVSRNGKAKKIIVEKEYEASSKVVVTGDFQEDDYVLLHIKDVKIEEEMSIKIQG